MKKISILAILFCFSFISYGQVTGVKYQIEVVDGTENYDCRLIIDAGSATTFPQRLQLISQFVIVVPTGTAFELLENFNPLLENETETGTEPIDWEIINSAISPAEQPESDYYAVAPVLTDPSSYNTLNAGNVVPLFRIHAGVDCNLDVRPLDNSLDETAIGTDDYTQGFTIGSTDQVYAGNELPSSFDADFLINDGAYTNCFGGCVTISPEVVCAPPVLSYQWSTGEITPEITVCPEITQTYAVTVSGPQGLIAFSSVSVAVVENIIYFDDVDFFCVGSSYFAFSEFGGDDWTSSDPSIASFDLNELFINGEGTVTISVTSESGGCVTELEITTSGAPEVGFEGPSMICVGRATNVFPSTGGTWTTDNTSIATVTNTGLVNAISPGTTYLQFTNMEGCTAITDMPLTVLSGPFIQNSGSDELCVGETTLMASLTVGTWESSSPLVATIDNSGLVTAISAGSATFTFTETGSSNQCSSTSSPITVNASPPVIITGPSTICIGEATTLSPTVGGTWISSDPSILSINNAGVAVGLDEGIATVMYQSTTTGCSSAVSSPITVSNCTITPALVCSQAEVICDIDLLNGFSGQMPSETSGGNQPVPLCFDPNSSADNISWIAFVAPAGDYDMIVTPFNCQGGMPGNAGAQIGIYTSCDFNESIYCNPICGYDPAVIGSGSFVPGEEYLLFIDGCTGTICEYEIQFEGDYISQCDGPCDDVTVDTPWAYVPAGEFDQEYNIVTYSTGTNLESENSRDHLVFYDYNTGNVYLKENNGNGFLDTERLLFNNEDHYANGVYQIYLEDIDNDGLTDIILAESNIVTTTGDIGDQISVYQNNDNYFFERKINEQVCGMEWPNNLKIADYDNDGMKDIFFVCADFIYDILWINNWDDTELTNFNNQTFCHVYTGDFNQDGFQDIALSDDIALINNGDRTFSNSQFLAIESECSTLNYFVEETNTILGPYFASKILDTGSLETAFCSDHYFGDDENEIFRANIYAPDRESIVIPQIEGFYAVDPNQECNFSIDGVEIPNVVARHNTKIDLTRNGCTDFLVIQGDQIFAWINPKQANKILGTAFIDENDNGTYDSNELPLRNVLVSISPGDFSILTDDDGNYAFSVAPGTYTLTANVNEGEWQESQLTINDIQINEPCNEGYNFGFVPDSGSIEMASISMVNSIARCDFETRFTITVENTGEEPIDGILGFVFDSETTFFSTDLVDPQVSGSSVVAEIGILAPFSPQTYKVTVKMPSGSSNLPLLDFEAILFSNTTGGVIAQYGYSDQLRCSYDPNDKREYPDREGEENFTLMDEDIEYTIRFQNNGNDTAFQVKIVDPLDPNIDPSSIRVVNSSHAVETCIEGTDLIFLFEDIFLVDSMTNYAGSQGFVTFRCNAKDGRAELTPVHNQADIIFDTNAPIVTNQTINTLVSELCTNKETLIEASICDGDTYDGQTEPGIYTTVFTLPFGCDSVVTLMLEVQEVTFAQQNIEVCAGSAVTINDIEYLIDDNTTIIDTTVSAAGCITNILTYEIEAVGDIFDVMDYMTFCIGEASSVNFGLDGTWISNDETVITVTENGSTATIGSGSTTLTYTDSGLGCMDDLEVTVFPDPTITSNGVDQICVTDSMFVIADTPGSWISSPADLATVTNSGFVLTVNPGIVEFIFTDSVTGCSSRLPVEIVSASDPLCIVGTYDLDKTLVKLYPNPASESIFIDTEELWESIRIYDTQGQTISHLKHQKTGRLELDVSQFSSGVYMIIFQDGDSSLTKMFVVR